MSSILSERGMVVARGLRSLGTRIATHTVRIDCDKAFFAGGVEATSYVCRKALFPPSYLGMYVVRDVWMFCNHLFHAQASVQIGAHSEDFSVGDNDSLLTVQGLDVGGWKGITLADRGALLTTYKTVPIGTIIPDTAILANVTATLVVGGGVGHAGIDDAARLGVFIRFEELEV